MIYGSQVAWLGWNGSYLVVYMKVETLRSDDGDRNENITKAIGLITNLTTILLVHHAFLYISLPSLRDYDVKFNA